MSFVNFDALHQYSDDSEIVSLVKFYADSVDDQGIVRAPGKFEGEPIWAVYFYGWMMQGVGDTTYDDCEHAPMLAIDPDFECDCELDEAYTQFDVTAGDAEAFPALESSVGKSVRVRTDSSGFVYAWIVEPAADPVEDLHANPYI